MPESSTWNSTLVTQEDRGSRVKHLVNFWSSSKHSANGKADNSSAATGEVVLVEEGVYEVRLAGHVHQLRTKFESEARALLDEWLRQKQQQQQLRETAERRKTERAARRAARRAAAEARSSGKQHALADLGPCSTTGSSPSSRVTTDASDSDCSLSEASDAAVPRGPTTAERCQAATTGPLLQGRSLRRPPPALDADPGPATPEGQESSPGMALLHAWGQQQAAGEAKPWGDDWEDRSFFDTAAINACLDELDIEQNGGNIGGAIATGQSTPDAQHAGSGDRCGTNMAHSSNGVDTSARASDTESTPVALHVAAAQRLARASEVTWVQQEHDKPWEPLPLASIPSHHDPLSANSLFEDPLRKVAFPLLHPDHSDSD